MSDDTSLDRPVVAELIERPIPPTIFSVAPPPPPPTPVTVAERIDALDVLRGFALLGILVMNIQSFSMPGAAYMNPTAYGDLSGANYTVWHFSHLLVDMKFMAMFSMLFGAGIVLMSKRREAAGAGAAGLHYRRMGILAGFGLLHAYLLWEGDILFAYAICGMIVYPMRRLPPAALTVLGIAAISVASLIWLLTGWSMQFWPPESIGEIAAFWRPSPEELSAEIAAVQGGWFSAFQRRLPLSFFFQTQVLLTWGLWRAGGLMLIGMALAKWGVLYGRAAAWVYGFIVAAAIGIGLPVIYFGVLQQFAHNWSTEYGMFLGTQYNYWASLMVSLGWIGAIMLATKPNTGNRLAKPLAAVGRMALTNYLLQTLIATTIFYGYGFGLFGQVDRVGQIQVVLGIWGFQLAISPLWLHWFHFGPAEWLWRSLTYCRRQPLVREA